jgi:two-component system, OmpR family, KDP operon response regulator KdpE
MMEHQGSVLFIEDDSSIRRSLRATLTALGFTVGEASNGEEGLLRMQTTEYEAVLLDINMPGIGGMETCRRLRQSFPRAPILMLTVREGEDDKVEALESGADDYITKPFHIRELIARLRVAIRRQRSPVIAADVSFRIGAVLLDPLRHRVEKSGQMISLTPKEFDTLHYLMQHAGQPVTHARLLMAVWGPEYGNEREYLRVIVRQLRVKLEENPSRPKYLLTEPYIGYRFAGNIAED